MEMFEIRKKKNHIWLVSLIVVGILLSAQFVQIAQLQNEVSTLRSSQSHTGNPAMPYSYEIFSINDIIFAKNGTTGQIDYSGTDAATVINAALASLTTGGKVVLKHGLYIITSPIYIDNPSIDFSMEDMWMGQQINTMTQLCGLKLANGSNCPVLVIGQADLSGSNARKCHVHDLYIDANKAGQTTGNGIDMDTDGALDLHLNDVYVMNAKNSGIYWRGGAGIAERVYVEYCDSNGWVISNKDNRFIGCGSWWCDVGFRAIYQQNEISDCIVYGSTKYGILSSGYDVQIIGNRIYQSGREGIQVWNSRNIVVGNLVESPSMTSNNTYDGIQLTTAGTSAQYCIVKGNIIYSDQTNKPRYCISELSSADYNIIEGNVVLNAQTFPILKQGANTVVKSNVGYVTENSGTATVASGEWILHGLAGTPTNVIVTTRTTIYGTPAVPVVVGWANQNSTRFQVSVYWINGTAITADVINISWVAEHNP